MRIHKVLIAPLSVTATLAAGIFIAPAMAQPMLSLDDAIRLSLQNNYSLSISRDQAEVATVNRQGGTGVFLPSASADLTQSGKLNGGSPQTRVGASLNWVVFDGFQSFHAFGQLKSRERQAGLEERTALEGLMESVMNAYYDIVQQKQRLGSIHELLSVSEERGKLANAKLEIGAGSRLDQLQSVADLNTDSSSYLTQLVSLHTAKIKFNQLLARDPALDFEVADSIPLSAGQPVDEWRKVLVDNNSSIASARAQRDVSSEALSQARGQWLPSVSAGLAYSSAPSALNTNTTTFNGGWTYNANVSVPLFDKLATPTGVRRAKIQLREGETQVKQTELDVTSQFEQARTQYESGLRQAALEDRNLQVAKLQAEGAQERYRVGASSSLEFRDAQTRLLDAEVRLIAARQSAKQSETALRKLSGLLIRQAPVPTEGK